MGCRTLYLDDLQSFTMYIDPLGHSDTPRMTAREIVSGWTIYVSPLVHSLSLDKLQFVPLAAVVVDPQGIIHQVEELDDLLSEAQITAKCDQLKLELQDQVVGESVSISMTRLNEGYLCPGLVDTHCVCGIPSDWVTTDKQS